jgi:hypothetical protein
VHSFVSLHGYTPPPPFIRGNTLSNLIRKALVGGDTGAPTFKVIVK